MSKTEFSFRNEVAIVTGAASGIGRATATAFAKAGAQVALLDRDGKGIGEVAQNLGTSALPLCFDITRPDELRQALEETKKKMGHPDILVNSAGMSARVPAEDYSLDDYDRLITLNVRALFSLMQLCAKHWIAQRRPGAIVNLASIFGIIADPLSAPYAASKGAVIQLTKTCAVEWAPYGIRVNAVAPGYTYTPMTAKTLDSEAGKKILSQVPMNRPATVDEIASAVLFLSSDAATFITGQTLAVDGGRTAI